MFVIMCFPHAQAEGSEMSTQKGWLELGLIYLLRLQIERFEILF